MSTYFETGKSFGVVTVMDIDIYDYDESVETVATTPKAYYEAMQEKTPIGHIDHLQVATLSTEGPTLTINGGKFNNALIKYGKTARCEMTDALGNPDVLVALGGAIMADGILSITDKFRGPVTLIGDTFVVDEDSGKHVPVKVLMYKFLPDSTPSFAFDSGNAATFDLNGDLLAIELGGETGDHFDDETCPDALGYFFSLVPSSCSVEEASSN